jgi:hypothetical protein
MVFAGERFKRRWQTRSCAVVTRSTTAGTIAAHREKYPDHAPYRRVAQS